MTKPTHAHLSRTLNRNQPMALKERTKSQMEYYMGAKLIEIGVEPKSAIYRWSLETNATEEIWTYSAYWGESKEQILQGKQPLTGVELIDCARANVSQGVETTVQLCGYGDNLNAFEEALKEAGKHLGMEIESLADLLTETGNFRGRHGIEVAPDTSSSL
jgi:hypothetical protein